MFELIDRALNDSFLPYLPLGAGRRKSGDAEWDDPDALIEDEYEDELDDDEDETDDDLGDGDIEEDDDLADDDRSRRDLSSHSGSTRWCR